MTMCCGCDEATKLPACHRGENILSGHFVNLSMASEKSPQCLGRTVREEFELDSANGQPAQTFGDYI